MNEKSIRKEVSFTNTVQKKGISLITLVITIVVVIILAAAVVMSLNNNNVLTNASSARYETDRDSMQSYLELTIQKATLRHQGTLELDSGKVAMDSTSNVKDSKGTITWRSTDIGNLSGEIIFDEGIDTDTTFYTGYKLPVYGSETKWYIDENGKLILQVGSRIYGADKLPNSGLDASAILQDPQKYYGAYVNYTTSNTLSEDYKWRIFYATDSNIFLIASNYINANDFPETSKGNKADDGTDYSKGYFDDILNDYKGTYDIPEDIKWFNKSFFDKIGGSGGTVFCAMAYMLDKSIWTSKFNGVGADYVVGAPSLDMLLTSYNQKTGTNIYQTSADPCYKLSYDGGVTWEYSINDSSKYLTQGDGLYSINNRNYSCWISSPSAYPYATGYMFITYNGSVRSFDENGFPSMYMGFRPIVCLKSNVSLKEIEEGKSYRIQL